MTECIWYSVVGFTGERNSEFFMGNNKAIQNKRVEKQKLLPKDDVFMKLS